MPKKPKPPIKNMGASVRSRLLNLSKQRRQPFDLLLNNYVLERLLYRLSQTQYAADTTSRSRLAAGRTVSGKKSFMRKPVRRIRRACTRLSTVKFMPDSKPSLLHQREQ